MSQNCYEDQQYWGAENVSAEESHPWTCLYFLAGEGPSGSNRHFTSVDELKAPGLIQDCYDFSCVPRKLGVVSPEVQSTVGKNRGRGSGEQI